MSNRVVRLGWILVVAITSSGCDPGAMLGLARVVASIQCAPCDRRTYVIPPRDVGKQNDPDWKILKEPGLAQQHMEPHSGALVK